MECIMKLPGKAGAVADQRKVLTGRAEGYHMDRRDFPAVHLRNISQMRPHPAKQDKKSAGRVHRKPLIAPVEIDVLYPYPRLAFLRNSLLVFLNRSLL